MKMNTPTKLSSKPANKMEDHSRSVDTLKSRAAPILEMPFNNAQFQLPLMLPTGQDTQVEFSATAATDLTTVLLLLVLKVTIGLSRTPGEQAGERKAASDLQVETPAESATWLPTPTNDLNHHHYLNFWDSYQKRTQIIVMN